jgi:hypothetical protein
MSGVEPVNDFIESLPTKRAAKIDDHVEEHLNGRSPEAPPPAFPVTSQIKGELRELGAGDPDGLERRHGFQHRPVGLSSGSLNPASGASNVGQHVLPL